MTPRATYRLQFNGEFGFADAAALAPYLEDLGISHVYASPVFAARPGSTHGYDIVDHNRLNPELGTPDDFRRMAETFRENGIGLILDFVPNHMGIGGASNAFWLDVLAWGRASRFASWFDIDWNSPLPGLAGKVLVPFLGDQYGAVLADGGFDLRFDAENGAFAVWAHDSHKLPVCPAYTARILAKVPEADGLAETFETATSRAKPGDPGWAEAQTALARTVRDEPRARAAIEAALKAFRGQSGDLASWAALDGLIADQHWRAAKFNLDCDAINYRRFFTISDLAGLRVEDADVFEAVHRLLLDLIDEGLVDGVRIDHIDGLRDPKAYCLRLRGAASRPIWLLVEKILAPDEELAEEWGADGTTGYEVANQLVLLLTDPAGTETLSDAYVAFTGRDTPPREVVRRAKLEIMAGPMAAETEALAGRLHAIAAADQMTCDLGPIALRQALTQVVAALDVYRTYADADGEARSDRARIAEAVTTARAQEPALDPLLFDFLERALTLEMAVDRLTDAVARAQQLSGPVMAKGLEDTALYRYSRLIALNEVGSEPGLFGLDPSGFHEGNRRRLEREPLAMLTTSTHDTKRGEDARMRIAALAGRAAEWRAAAPEWRVLLEPGTSAIDPNDVYFLFQLLLGVWPFEWRPETEVADADLAALAERFEAAMLKSVREARERSRWVFGDAEYEAGIRALARRALDPVRGAAFLSAFRRFEARIAPDAARLALVQTVLKLTIPGVPDIYQGAELWEQSLVDPDNRRPVDFAARAKILATAREDRNSDSARDWSDGTLKLATTAALLDFRRRDPDLFLRGSYEPLSVEGPGAGDVLAFAREYDDRRMIVATALRPARMPGPETRLGMPLRGVWEDVMSGRKMTDPRMTDLFADLPFTVSRRL